MRHYLFILLISGLMISCGSQRKLHKSYSGKPVTDLETEYGNPSAIIEMPGDSIYVFEKTEELRSTEINQGKLSLDPIVTPAVTKTQRFYFTVKNGIITSVRTDEEYKR